MIELLGTWFLNVSHLYLIYGRIKAICVASFDKVFAVHTICLREKVYRAIYGLYSHLY